MFDGSGSSEEQTLVALITDIACDLDGFLVVLFCALKVSERLIDRSEIPERPGFSRAMGEVLKQRQRLFQARFGLRIIGLFLLDGPQLQQPLSLQNRHRPLFVVFLPLIRVRCGLGLHPEQPSGLSDGFSELAVLVDAELGSNGLGLL